MDFQSDAFCTFLEVAHHTSQLLQGCREPQHVVRDPYVREAVSLQSTQTDAHAALAPSCQVVFHCRTLKLLLLRANLYLEHIALFVCQDCRFLVSKKPLFSLFCDLKMSSLSDFFFAAAVASFLSLSSAAVASSHVSACSLVAASSFFFSAAPVASLCPSMCSLVAAGSSSACLHAAAVVSNFCTILQVHGGALFESGSLLRISLLRSSGF